jgi:hypothetical protein
LRWEAGGASYMQKSKPAVVAAGHSKTKNKKTKCQTRDGFKNS